MKNFKNKVFVLSLMPVVWAQSALADGGDFDQFNDTVTTAASSAQTAIGRGFHTFVAVLPLVMMVIGIFGGLRYLRKHSNGHEENFAKQLGYGTAGAAIAMLLVAIVITALSTALLGNASAMWGAISGWWETALGLGGGAAGGGN